MRRCHRLLFLLIVWAALRNGTAQTGAYREPVPHADPGYGLYFHDTDEAPLVASRWGYHEGWAEGRYDRNHAEVRSPEEKEHYKDPPEHERPEGMTRESFTTEYRRAYIKGYEHGSRI